MIRSADQTKEGLRILMLCPQFRPIVGGYERAAERLSATLSKRGHAVTVIAERRDLSWPDREYLNGVQIRRLRCLYRPHLHIITSIIAFAFFLITQGRHYQIWHVHQYGMHAVLAVAMGKLLNRTVVLKLTNSGKNGIQQSTSTLPLGSLAGALLRKVAAVVALTRETKAEAEAFGFPPSRIHTLGNGVTAHGVRPSDKNERMHLLRYEQGLRANGMVLFVGRLVEQKNPDGLMLAWKRACNNLPKGWILVYVGDGSMRAQLESSAVSKGLSDSVSFAGQQPDVEVWMAAADIFVLPSHREGLSNTMLEAMATGLPVISTRVSGSVEVLEETGAGIVVDVRQINQLAEAIVHLASDPVLRARMGRIGRAVVKGKYTIESVAERHEALYRNLIGLRE